MGNRYVGTGDLGSVGSNGYYWAAVPSSSTGGRALGFSSGSVNPVNSLNRGDGFAVRCVSELSPHPRSPTVFFPIFINSPVFVRREFFYLPPFDPLLTTGFDAVSATQLNTEAPEDRDKSEDIQ